MSAIMDRKKNIFEKLSPLWAFLGMALHIGAVWYVLFYKAGSYETAYDYRIYIRYIIWITVVVVSTWSFVPESITAIVRHTMFYLLSAAVCIGAVYYYAQEIFSYDSSAYRNWLLFADNMSMDELIDGMSSPSRESYIKLSLTYAVRYSVYLCGAVAAFAAIKYHMSASGWIKKRVE